MTFPLAGLRVLDLSRVVSGPFAGRILSDLGADVVKVEPPEGDVTRVWGEVRHGLSGFYTQQNAGKRDVCIDLKAPGGGALVQRLAARADVVIENFRPGVADRLGVGYGALSASNPRVVMLSVTGFGHDSPDAHRQAYAPVIDAEAGLIGRQAAFDDVASDPMLSIADTNAALHGLVAVLAALHLRATTGTGQHIDMAMLDAMVATDDYAHHALDRSPIRRLGGEVWEAPGGPILVAGEFRNTWVRLRHVVADPSPEGADLDTKIVHRRQAVAAWMASFADRDQLKRALEAADLAWGDVRSPFDAVDQPSITARRMAAEVDDRGGGQRRVVQSPYRFSDADSGVRGPAPHRGEHNTEVLRDWLDLDASAVEPGVLLAEERP
ncbi:MAG TPA: CoA transferase [Acidimicrobiales bacterium]|nr:CoA transferase [Acidimicrobiales bacterium]